MAYSIVRGKRLRLTKTSRCGFPLAGAASTIVTKGFVTVTLTPVMKDATDIEQLNADGELCISDRTAPELKWYTVEAVFCAVDPELLNLASGYALVTDYDGKPVGFRVGKSVKVDGGIGLELWSGVPAGDDCALPVGNAAPAPTLYGYTLVPSIVEATLGNVEFGATATTFTLTGRTTSAEQWGLGPYLVVPADEDNTPGRLTDPWAKDEHLHMQSTTIAPPAVTDGSVPLVLPTPYYV